MARGLALRCAGTRSRAVPAPMGESGEGRRGTDSHVDALLGMTGERGHGGRGRRGDAGGRGGEARWGNQARRACTW
nr:MAG TPA: hypothetical protein [Bacteriophage sp.]